MQPLTFKRGVVEDGIRTDKGNEIIEIEKVKATAVIAMCVIMKSLRKHPAEH